MELQNLTCKCCTAPLDFSEAVGRVLRCKHCGTTHMLAREDDGKVVDLLRNGELFLDTCKFDDAYTAYAKAAELDKEEPEAYFGMAVASFKVQYLKDEANDPPRLQPVCHEVTGKKFTADKNYLRALQLATTAQREEYIRRGEEIDYILGEFYKLKQAGVGYDCFLCVKVSDENGGKTEDSRDADFIYDNLRDKGYKPFYSERELRNVPGADYEARILYALYTSECMLVICRNESYLQTPWVKNEYTRFLKLVNDAEKESDSITVVFYEQPIERLPGRKGKLQGIDFSRREADGKIVDFVESHTPEARRRKEEAARKKAEEEESLRRQSEQFQSQSEEMRRVIEESKRRQEEEERRRQEREEEEKKRNANLQAQLDKLTHGERSTTGNLLTRAWQEMDSRNFQKSWNLFESVLEREPENEEAWRGKFLSEFGVTSEAGLINAMTRDMCDKILNSSNLKNFLRYKTSGRYDEYYKKLSEKIQSVVNREINKSQQEINATQQEINATQQEMDAAQQTIGVWQKKTNGVKRNAKFLRILLTIFVFLILTAVGAGILYGLIYLISFIVNIVVPTFRELFLNSLWHYIISGALGIAASIFLTRHLSIYWYFTGGKKIEAFQKNIGSLKSDIETKQANVDTYKSNIDANKNYIDACNKCIKKCNDLFNSQRTV